MLVDAVRVGKADLARVILSEPAAQSLYDACSAASTGLRKAMEAYGEGTSDGDTVEVTDLQAHVHEMADTVTSLASSISNEKLTSSMNSIALDVQAMAGTVDEQAAAMSSTGSVADELNDRLEAQTNVLNDHVNSLATVCNE